MKRLKRPVRDFKCTKDELIEDWESILGLKQKALEGNDNSFKYLRNIYVKGRDLAACVSYFYPELTGIQDECLFLSAESMVADLALVHGDHKKLLLGNQPIQFQTSKFKRNNLTNLSTWMNALFLNAICRRSRGLAQLTRMNLDLLRPEAAVRHPPQLEKKIAAFQAFARNDPQVGKKLVEAQHATDPRLNQGFETEFILAFDVFHIHLLALLIRGEEQEFEDVLYQALEAHHDYWKIENAESVSSDAFLSFPLIALAGIAYNRGMRFEIDSEYLPMRLVRGEFDFSESNRTMNK
ncbi:Hypothetical protein PBC10988_26190 [Planctomycetales bacterium 10988]|nr:Hypothetical protein PBC10988_26190 [Planctomycetales bacterium 10988]